MGLDLRQVQYFLAVAQHGSLGRAAEDLGVSQPALTTGLRRLERRLDARLFDRSRQGSALTGFGTAFLPHGRAIAEAARQAEADFDALRAAPRARLGIGCGPSLALKLVPDAIARLRALRVTATVRVVEGTFDALRPLLERGDIELAIGTVSEDLEPRGLSSELLLRDPVGLVAARGHALARARQLTLARCLDGPWVLPTAGDPLRRWLAECFTAQGLAAPEATVETGSFSVIRGLLLRDGFLSVLPLALVDGASGVDGLQALRIAQGPWQRSVSVVHRRDAALSPTARRFVQCLKSVAASPRAARPADRASP